MQSVPTVQRTVSARIPTLEGGFILHHFHSSWDQKEHLALVMGEIQGHGALVRIHSECFTGDVLGSRRCDCGEQLAAAMQAIAAEGRGAVIYLRQEGRGIGLAEKLRAYNLQDAGYDTVDANLLLGHQADEREYTAAALILQDLGVQSIRLLTNNPAKIEALNALGMPVQARVPLQVPAHPENQAYLEAKVSRMRHLLSLNGHYQDPGEEDPCGPLWHELDSRMEAHSRQAERPFVTLSYAQSLDGCLTARRGTPFPVSSPASLRMTHRLRATHQAILVGIETVLADDPSLTVRLADGVNPQPIIVDSHLRTPPQARLLQAERPVWIATTEQASPANRQALELAGARIFVLPHNHEGRVSLPALLRVLAQEDVSSVMVEGGACILTSFLREGLASYAVVTVAPVYLGGYHVLQPGGSDLADGGTMPRLRNTGQTRLDTDTVLWGELV